MSIKEGIIALAFVGAVTAIDSTPRPIASAGDRAFQTDRSDRTESSVYYAGCNEVRALGKAPLYAGQPGYRVGMDGDRDGIACEPPRRRRR